MALKAFVSEDRRLTPPGIRRADEFPAGRKPGSHNGVGLRRSAPTSRIFNTLPKPGLPFSCDPRIRRVPVALP